MKPRPQFFARVLLAGLAVLVVSMLLTMALAGCRVARPIPSVSPTSMSETSLPDSTVRDNPTPQKAPSEKPGLIARIFHSGQVRYNEKKQSNPTAFINPTSVPKKCKGCQFTIITGNDNKVSQATIGKSKAPAVVNSDSATQQVATNAVAGRGNTATQTATTQAAPGAWATVAGKLAAPLPWLLLALLTAGFVFRKRLPFIGPFFS
jgi:hypothetical protein